MLPQIGLPTFSPPWTGQPAGLTWSLPPSKRPLLNNVWLPSPLAGSAGFEFTLLSAPTEMPSSPPSPGPTPYSSWVFTTSKQQPIIPKAMAPSKDFITAWRTPSRQEWPAHTGLFVSPGYSWASGQLIFPPLHSLGLCGTCVHPLTSATATTLLSLAYRRLYSVLKHGSKFCRWSSADESSLSLVDRLKPHAGGTPVVAIPPLLQPASSTTLVSASSPWTRSSGSPSAANNSICFVLKLRSVS
jgi:hypothetical protein